MSHTKNQARAKVPESSSGGPSAPRQTEPSIKKKHVNRMLCRTSEYKPPGSDKVGLAPNNQPSKVVWELEYGLTHGQFEALSKRFPGIAFVQTGFECHDHPIAHTSYRIVWENVMKKLKPGSRVADIAGNPAYNERFNSRQKGRNEPVVVDTFCKVLSPKDSIRAKTRWGPSVTNAGVTRWEEMTLYDMYRNEENRARFAQYNTFLMNHVLYYYTMEEITKLLTLNGDSVLYATIHKLDGQNGKINCGEQEYLKDLQTGRVTQRNVETGEKYEHPDPAPWFKNFCYADRNGAIAWTINKGCDDTYIVTITSTDPKLVPEDCWLDGRIIFSNGIETVEIPVETESDPPPAYTVEKVVIKTHDFFPGVSKQGIPNKEVVVDITHPELFESLKTFMVNKPRNAVTLRDLTHKAHREAGNNTLMGNNRRIKISAEALTLHVFAAWTSGAALESSLYAGLVANNSTLASVNRNLAGKGLALGPGNVAKQVVRGALSVNAIVRSREPVEAVLRHLDDLL